MIKRSFDLLRRAMGLGFPFNERIFKEALRGVGMEIGALNNPMVVNPGVKVLQFDYLDTAGLRIHYPEWADIEIVNVDVIGDVHNLDSIFVHDSLDFVIANQIIEHVVDVLGTLIQIYQILHLGGILHLAIPDKRLTFDQDRPRTSLDHLIEDHRVPKGAQIEERVYQHYREWVELVPQYYPEDRRKYVGNLERLWNDRYAIHLHVWEPDDWSSILNYLNQNGYPFYLVDHSNVPCQDRNEFVLILRKEAVSCSPLPRNLKEKGPVRWFASRFLRNKLHPLKRFVGKV